MNSHSVTRPGETPTCKWRLPHTVGYAMHNVPYIPTQGHSRAWKWGSCFGATSDSSWSKSTSRASSSWSCLGSPSGSTLRLLLRASPSVSSPCWRRRPRAPCGARCRRSATWKPSTCGCPRVCCSFSSLYSSSPSSMCCCDSPRRWPRRCRRLVPRRAAGSAAAVVTIRGRTSIATYRYWYSATRDGMNGHVYKRCCM